MHSAPSEFTYLIFKAPYIVIMQGFYVAKSAICPAKAVVPKTKPGFSPRGPLFRMRKGADGLIGSPLPFLLRRSLPYSGTRPTLSICHALSLCLITEGVWGGRRRGGEGKRRKTG